MGIKLISQQRKNYRISFWYKNKCYRKIVYGNKRLAEEVEAKIRLELAEGSYFPGRNKKEFGFGEIADRFIRDFAAHRPTCDGQKHYQYGALKAKEFIGSKKLSAITPEDVRQYRYWLGQKGYHPVSVNHFQKTLRRILNWAKEAGLYCGDNPASSSKIKLPSELKHWRREFLTQDQFKRLLEVADERIRPLILCAVHTGMRRGELQRLRKKDINLDSCKIFIPDSKNGEPGEVHITESLYPVLEGIASRLPSPDSLIFDFSNFHNLWPKAKKDAGLAHIHFHDLRATFGTHLALATGNLAAVQTLLRLKSPAMVMRYSRLVPGLLKSAALTLDKQLALDTAQKGQIQGQPITNPITPHFVSAR